MLALLDRERTVAGPGFNRWLVPPAALAVHLSIGQVYAFSVFNVPLQERFGANATDITIIFSIAIVMLGLSAAFGGTWVERNGPRKAMALSATCWSLGFLIAALGISSGQLWLVYLGYGVLGGIGLGIGYISPVSTLIKWFPDRPGLATGLAIMGFGGGALVASPLSNRLLGLYAENPADALVPVFLTLGITYAVLMALGAYVVRVPAADWRPAGWTPPAASDTASMKTTANVSAANAIKTPQFWLLWTVLFCNVTAGIGILAQAAPMVTAFFSSVGPAEAAGYVGLLSLANMAGRIVWSSTSDVIGRKNTYIMYLGVGRRRLPARRAVRHSCPCPCSSCSPWSSSASTAAGSPRSRPTSRTCSAGTRSAPSTAGCSPPGPPPASPGRSSSAASSTCRPAAASRAPTSTRCPCRSWWACCSSASSPTCSCAR